MAKSHVPHFHNDAGISQIEIGVKEFMCVGAKAPHDHPHVFLDMGEGNDKVCPYCSTLFKFNGELAAVESIPAGCLLEEQNA